MQLVVSKKRLQYYLTVLTLLAGLKPTERQAKAASAMCNNSFTGRSQLNFLRHSWSVPSLLRGMPTDFSSNLLHSHCPKQ